MNEINEWSKALKPANGLMIVDPATSRAIDQEGTLVRGNAEYWLRRLRDGDVIELTALPSAATPSARLKSSGQESKS